MDGRCMLYLSVISLVLMVTTAHANSEAPTCRVQDCPNYRTIRYYEELGCVRNDGSSECCPTRFDCSSVLSLDKTKCHYEGKSYEPGSDLLGGIKNVCTAACVCHSDPEGLWKGEPSFLCAVGDCPGYPIPSGQESVCYPTYLVDNCCGNGIKCVNDTKSPRNVTECTYKGKTFLEGQFIEGAGSECMRCVCQEGYDGTLREPWCRRHSCDYTLGRPVSQLVGCAPVFNEDDKCCAYNFHCTSANDSVVRHPESATSDEGDQCSFGGHRLNIGDELLSTSNGCVKCRCDIPPFITCTQLPGSVCTKSNK